MRVSVFIAVSLDGFIARRDGGLDWLLDSRYSIAGEDFGYASFTQDVDLLLMGRGTYDTVTELSPWPYGALKVMVATRNPLENQRAGVEASPLAPRELVAELRNRGYRKIYLDGGRLIQSFLNEKLVSDMIITRLPVLIGQGLPLFGALSGDILLRHSETETWPNGFVQSRYEIA